MEVTSESLAVLATAVVAIVVPWLSYRFSRATAADERRFQKRSDVYTRLMLTVERLYKSAYWSYPSRTSEPLAEPPQEEVEEIQVLLTLHASERVGLLLEEFNDARKRVHAASGTVAGIRNATDMGMQEDVERAAEVSLSHEVERGAALEWLRECRNELRAQVRLELHGSQRNLSWRDRQFANRVRSRARNRVEGLSFSREQALSAARGERLAADEQ